VEPAAPMKNGPLLVQTGRVPEFCARATVSARGG
jgi:hypothetical protein